MNPKVSVIIPYYNDYKYIEETLESVKQQTYSNIEVILIDDGSTDPKSINIFNSVEFKDCIKIHKKNGGPSSARNLGITKAKGKYILPLDSDDKIAPSYIDKAVRILESDPKCGIVYCKSRFFGQDSGQWNLPRFTVGKMLISNIIFNAGLFRKEDWDYCHGYDEELKVGIEDWDFWLSILELNRSVYQIPEVLFYYRIKPISRNKNFAKEKEVLKETFLYIQNKHKEFYKEHFNEYLIESRNIILDQDFEILKLRKKGLKSKFGNTFPILRKLWHALKYR
jgi:glycosyltransferase involved in cell wall biosynthesis